MGKFTKKDMFSKIGELNLNLDKFLESAEKDDNLLRANKELLQKKEDLEGDIEIHIKTELNLRRELKTANDEIVSMRKKLTALEKENQILNSANSVADEATL